MKGFGTCVAVRICPRICFCGESISKNAFRWFESVYRPEMMRKARKCIYKISKNFRVEKSGEISRNLRFSCALARFSCLHLNQTLMMAGMAGFEPTDAGVKVPCLTAWRHPNMMYRSIVPQNHFFVKSCFEKSLHFENKKCREPLNCRAVWPRGLDNFRGMRYND